MNFLPLFLKQLRNSRTSTLLNLFGLTIALSSFIILIAQVRYELTYDTHFRDADRIFRIERDVPTELGVYSPLLCRPLGERMLASSPDIEAGGVMAIPQRVSVHDFAKGEEDGAGLTLYRISRSMFDVLGTEIVAGDIDRFDDSRGTVILSQSATRSIFGSADPIGKSVVVNGDETHPGEVIAVCRDCPDNSSFQANSLFTNILDESIEDYGEFSYIYFIKAVRTGNPARIAADLGQSVESLSARSQDESAFRVRCTPVSQMHFMRDIRFDFVDKSNPATVYTLLTIAVLILLIAIINFVNFATARLPMRIRQINTRKVLGESNGSIRRGLLAESVLTVFVAYLSALILTEYLSTTAVASLVNAPINLAENADVALGTGLVAIVLGTLAGLYPAAYSTSFPPAMILKGSFGLSVRGRRLRTTLISFQYVVSIVLIVAALSVWKQNRFMLAYDMGVPRENILVAELGRPAANSAETLAQKLKTDPRIVDVTFANGPLIAPSRMNWSMQYRNKHISFDCYPVAPNFPKFMGIDIIEGRDFTANDEQKENASLIFNRTAQLRDGITVGDRIWGDEIVGIARDFNFMPLQYAIDPFAFMVRGKSYAFKSMNYLFVKTRTADYPELFRHIRETIRQFDGGWNDDVRFLDEHIGSLYRKERATARQITLFCLLSVFISLVGIFGLILFETEFRRKEIGLRKVYGATTGEILGMINMPYIRLVLICFALGAPIGYFVSRNWIDNFAYRTTIGPWIFVSTAAIVLLLTVATITVRSYRTAAENPIKSIKTE